MSQSHPAQFDNLDEIDPLLAFGAESPIAESPEKSPSPTSPAVAPPAEDASALLTRLGQTEQSLEQAQSEIAALKSDLRTLVATVDDIKKRLNRRPEVPVPALPRVPHRSGFGWAAAMVILLVTLGAAIWGATAVALIEIPMPLPIDTESPVAAPAPKPAVARVPR